MEPVIENTTNYNALYPKPTLVLSAILKEYLESGRKLQLGTYQDTSTKQTFPFLIKKCLKTYFKKMCSNCNGSHQFIVAGGYASYLAKKTTTFTDIDLYIHCTSLLDQDTITSDNYKIKTSGVVSTIAYNNRPKVQFIQVTFDVGVNQGLQQTDTFRNLMAVYVINKFDLPLCRVAAHVSFRKDLQMAYIIDASGIEIYKTPTSEVRRLKYEARRVKNTSVSVPSLQLSTVFSIIEQLS